MRLFVPALVLLLLAAPAGAGQLTVYRCTDGAGHVSLRDTPCPAGLSEQVIGMQRPIDPPRAPAAAGPGPIALLPAPASSARVVFVEAPRPLYQCTTPDGDRYTSEDADGNPRWVPLWTLGWPVQADGARDSLAITGGSIRIDDSGARVVRPLPRPAWPASAGTWIRDRCRQLAPTEACARLRDRRDEIRHRFFNAQPSERDVLRIERRGLLARLDADCA